MKNAYETTTVRFEGTEERVSAKALTDHFRHVIKVVSLEQRQLTHVVRLVDRLTIT